MNVMEGRDFEPKIYHQADTAGGPPDSGKGGTEGEMDPEVLRALMQEGRVSGPESSFGKFKSKLKALEKAKKPERKAEITKELGEFYESILHEGLDELGELETMLFRLHNPYPYDSRWGLQSFERLKRNINTSLRDKEIGEEGKPWLRRLKEDVVTMESLYHIEEAMGPSFMFYYDGELQLRVLRTIHSKATATDFRRVYSQELKGLGLGKDEEGNPIGLIGAEGLAKEGLREVLVSYNRDNLFWRFAVASAQQWDYDEPPPKPDDSVGSNERKQMYLEQRELDFIYLVFGEEDESGNVKYIDYKGHPIPEGILNFYNMESDEQTMERYYARMEALLLVDAKRRLDGGEEIKALAEEVKKLASGIEAQVDVSDEAELKQRLAQTATKAGIILDWGTMACGELGWGWKYEKNDKGKYERKSELGGIYSAFDVPTVMYWMRHNINYDDNSETRSSLIPPSVGHLKKPEQGVSPRNEWPKHRPDWKPDIEGALKVDPILRKEIERLRSNYYANVKPREKATPDVTFGKLDPKVLAYMEKSMWGFTTPFYNNFRKEDYFITIPMFFPTDIREMNFWRVVSLTEEGRTGPSAMDQFFAREDISTLNWEKMPMHRWDYINVNKDMMKRWLGLMVSPHEYSRDTQDEFDKFFEKPSGKAFKELAKRIRLAYRGGSVDMGVQEPPLIAMQVVMATAVKHGLLDPDFWKDNMKKSRWKEEIAEWMNEALNLPGKKADVENYGNSIALLIHVYAKLYWRLALATGDQKVEEHAGVKIFVNKEFSEARSK